MNTEEFVLRLRLAGFDSHHGTFICDHPHLGLIEVIVYTRRGAEVYCHAPHHRHPVLLSEGLFAYEEALKFLTDLRKA